MTWSLFFFSAGRWVGGWRHRFSASDWKTDCTDLTYRRGYDFLLVIGCSIDLNVWYRATNAVLWARTHIFQLHSRYTLIWSSHPILLQRSSNSSQESRSRYIAQLRQGTDIPAEYRNWWTWWCMGLVMFLSLNRWCVPFFMDPRFPICQFLSF